MSIRCRLGYHAPQRFALMKVQHNSYSTSWINAQCRRCHKFLWINWRTTT